MPIPSSTSLAAASAFASQGYMNIFVVLFVALLGNVAGDATGYLLARRYGEEVMAKIGFRRLLHSTGYKKVKDYIFDYPMSVIFFSRFLTELDAAVNLLSGLAKIPYKTFFLFDFLGETIYVLLYGLTGYYLGSQFQNNFGFFTKAGLAVLSIGVIINATQIFLYKKRRKKL